MEKELTQEARRPPPPPNTDIVIAEKEERVRKTRHYKGTKLTLQGFWAFWEGSKLLGWLDMWPSPSLDEYDLIRLVGAKKKETSNGSLCKYS